MCSIYVVACTWSIAHLTKCTVINLSIAQHLTNCAIFGKSRSALAIGLGLFRVKVRIRVRVRAGVRVSFRVTVRLPLGLGLRNWPNAQRVRSNAQPVW